MPQNRKSQPVVIVTGAGHGIGSATVQRLAADGWRTIAADKDKAAADRVAARSRGHAAEVDVSIAADIELLIDTTLRSHGRLDAVVSNAGVGRFGSLKDTTLGDWNMVLTTNLTAAFLLAKYAEDALREAQGAMVLIASTRAHMSEPDTHAYSASKGGLLALTHSLAISLGPDVRVNCISPGWIDTSDEALSETDHAQHPVGRVGRADDVAAAITWLVSENAGFITGTELIVDGGMTRKMIYL